MQLPNPPVDFGNADYLNYAVVKKAFGWSCNWTLRYWVKKGRLTRVQIGPQQADWRITRESAETFRQAVIDDADAGEFFGYGPARMASMRAAKKRRG